MKTQHLLTSLVLALSFVSVSCSKWNQNPLDGREPSLNNGSQKPTQPPGGKPTPSDAIIVDAVDYFSCKEGRTDELSISARILIPGYQYKISIENMDDFPNATFDAKTGKFKWTPARGTVVGEEMAGEKVLNVTVVAVKNGAPVLVGSKEITIGVSRAFSAPEIVSIKANKNKLRENETDTVTILVRDTDAVQSNQATWPTIQFINVIGGKSLVPFVSLAGEGWKNGQIEYTMRVDLTDAELTKEVTNYSFGVKASSRFGQTSNEQRVDYSIMTSFTDAATTWLTDLEGTPGSTLDYQFMVYDPKNETSVNVISFANLPKGAMASCTRVNTSNLTCGFIWKTDALTAVNNYQFTAKIEIRNADGSDTLVKPQDINLKVRIKPAPSPSPFPSPLQVSGGR